MNKKIIRAEDWKKLAAEYKEQAAENNFVQRTSTQCQNRILNLKDTYKKTKDQQWKSGEVTMPTRKIMTFLTSNNGQDTL